MSQLFSIGQNSVYALMVLAFIYIAKLIADWRTKDIDDDYEIEEKSNLAIGVRRAGLYISIAYAMSAPLNSGAAGSFATDLKMMAIDGILIIVLLFIARFISDVVILRHIDNDFHAKNGNVAVSIIEAGIYFATAAVIAGSLTGQGGGVVSSLVFFVLGQLFLVICFKLYDKITPYNLYNEIKAGNASAGIAGAGMLISFGIILKSALSGVFTGWIQDITSFVISAVAGVLLLLILKIFTGRLFLPNTDIKTEIERDKNSAALIVTESVMIAFALIIATVI